VTDRLRAQEIRLNRDDMLITIPNAQKLRPDLLTGGQPSEAQFLAAKEAGYQTVINLRGVGEPGTDTAPSMLAQAGVAYIHIPINGPGALTVDNAKLLDTALKENGGPVMVHCASGNRVGALFALRAFHLEGHSLEEALNVGRSTGMTRMEPMVRQLLERSAQS